MCVRYTLFYPLWFGDGGIWILREEKEKKNRTRRREKNIKMAKQTANEKKKPPKRQSTVLADMINVQDRKRQEKSMAMPVQRYDVPSQRMEIKEEKNAEM